MQRLAWALPTLALLGAFLAFPAMADTMDCPHPMDATISALRECVQHAAEMGHIDSPGIATSLLRKLDAAESALAQGQARAAIELLGAFIHEVQAQSGVHIDAAHADHMVMHAGMVLEALSG